jgi:hypothetical protein
MPFQPGYLPPITMVYDRTVVVVGILVGIRFCPEEKMSMSLVMFGPPGMLETHLGQPDDPSGIRKVMGHGLVVKHQQTIQSAT